MTLETFKKASQINKIRKYGFVAGLLIVLLYVSPYIVLGQNSHVTIHDNLDSIFTFRTTLIQNGQVFKSQSYIEQIMNGLPRHCFHSEFDVIVWFLLFFKPFTAYVLNTLLVHLIAFAGMHLLLRNHFLDDEKDALIILGTSLCFATLPFYSMFGLSIAGQPLLLHAFLNLRCKKQKIIDFLIIFIFPFYSSLVLSGIFIVFCLGIIFLYDSFKSKKINPVFLLGIAILSTTYVAVEYNLIYSTLLHKSFISHRTEWDLASRSYNLAEALRVGLKNFLFGHYHSTSAHKFILMLSVLTGGYLLVKKEIQREKNVKLLFLLLGVTLIISLFYGFYKWDGFIPLKEKLTILAIFQFDRFHYFFPILWCLIFALTLSIVVTSRYGKYLVCVLLISQLLYVTATSAKKGPCAKSLDAAQITYREFFSEDLFGEIGKFINLPRKDYRVVSIGIHPSITQYNGFYTLDSYQYNYPVEYKHKFRRIIEKELNKSSKWQKYFDYWGSRCYVFVAELENMGFLITKDKKAQIRNLELNTHALKEMGGKYIFSAAKVKNARHNDLKPLKVFEAEESPWRIYLYEVD
jgi:hypothetical protein